ncbi:MAG: cytoplasmic protein [Planctomycetes bacterium RBG_16_64_12]|nr:MAG: cytoplasmic protein [Planctomycetes bacterium RBG_16_64_12]
MTEEFVGEAIQPVVGTIDAARMSAGGPGLPRQFRWRLQTVQIARLLKTWRETGPCHHGSGETYVRKHWFEVVTDSGDTMKIYFERQPRSRRNRSRWWLFTIDKSPGPNIGVQDIRGQSGRS